MMEKLKDMRGGIILFLCLFLSINFYINSINEINTEYSNQISYYEAN